MLNRVKILGRENISIVRAIFKDAGFVYESLWIETNRVIWDFCFHEMNPRNESLKNRPTNQIHDTNL